jgi:Zn finger protein HypA/HybF involved in hydrogenase expression
MLNYRKIADSHPSLSRGQVWCRTCKRSVKVDSADCLQNGWPKCCGYTMTIDHPDTWKGSAE